MIDHHSPTRPRPSIVHARLFNPLKSALRKRAAESGILRRKQLRGFRTCPSPPWPYRSWLFALCFVVFLCVWVRQMRCVVLCFVPWTFFARRQNIAITRHHKVWCGSEELYETESWGFKKCVCFSSLRNVFVIGNKYWSGSFKF